MVRFCIINNVCVATYILLRTLITLMIITKIRNHIYSQSLAQSLIRDQYFRFSEACTYKYNLQFTEMRTYCQPSLIDCQAGLMDPIDCQAKPT